MQKHANEIIDIGLSDLADGVLMQAVLPLFYGMKALEIAIIDQLIYFIVAGKHTSSFRRRTEAIRLLQDLEVSTGFQTDSKIRELREIPLVS